MGIRTSQFSDWQGPGSGSLRRTAGETQPQTDEQRGKRACALTARGSISNALKGLVMREQGRSKTGIASLPHVKLSGPTGDRQEHLNAVGSGIPTTPSPAVKFLAAQHVVGSDGAQDIEVDAARGKGATAARERSFGTLTESEAKALDRPDKEMEQRMKTWDDAQERRFWYPPAQTFVKYVAAATTSDERADTSVVVQQEVPLQ